MNLFYLKILRLKKTYQSSYKAQNFNLGAQRENQNIVQSWLFSWCGFQFYRHKKFQELEGKCTLSPKALPCIDCFQILLYCFFSPQHLSTYFRGKNRPNEMFIMTLRDQKPSVILSGESSTEKAALRGLSHKIQLLREMLWIAKLVHFSSVALESKDRERLTIAIIYNFPKYSPLQRQKDRSDTDSCISVPR